jgi:hypothetical protein
MYNFHMESLRATVQHNHEWSVYVERPIHSKRHLFANHIIQHYPGNLQRQGNAVAEANLSSVVQRLGAAFYESPVKLIQALLNRHNQVSAERDHLIRTYGMEACSNAYQLPNGNEKDALLNLGKWGMELFQSSTEIPKGWI